MSMSTARDLFGAKSTKEDGPKTTTPPSKIMERKDIGEEMKTRNLAMSLRVDTKYSDWEGEQRKAAWNTMMDSRPNLPIKWPGTTPKKFWRQNRVSRTIFGVSTYAFHRVHSLQLAKMLQCVNRLYTIHEPMKHNSAMAGDVLQLTNNYMLNETKKLRMFKIDEIRETMIDNEEKYPVYSEVNMMFLKTFWDIVIDQEDFEIDVILMRKNFFSAIQSFMSELVGYEFAEDLTAENFINTTYSVNAVHNPQIIFPLSHANRVVRYLVDIEARTQKFAEEYYRHRRVNIIETTEEDLSTNILTAASIIKRLNLTFSESKLKKIYTKKQTKKTKYLPKCGMDVSKEKAKQYFFDYMTSIESKDLIRFPNIKSKSTYLNRKHKIVSAIFLHDVCPTHAQLRILINSLFMYSDAIYFIGDPLTCKDYATFSLSHRKWFVTLPSTTRTTQESLYTLYKEVAKKSNATHVISIRPDERLSDDFNSTDFLRQMIFTLEPGESIQAVSSSTGKNVPLAFALTDEREISFRPKRGVLTSSGKKYYLNSGVNLPGYPVYSIDPIREYDDLRE